jgi:hypothetical protein
VTQPEFNKEQMLANKESAIRNESIFLEPDHFTTINLTCVALLYSFFFVEQQKTPLFLQSYMQ